MRCTLSKEQRLSLCPLHLAWGWAGCSGGGSFHRPPLLQNPTCSAGGGVGGALQQSLKMAKAASPQCCQALLALILAKGWLFSCGYDEGIHLPRSPPLAFRGLWSLLERASRCSGSRPANCLGPALALQTCPSQSTPASARRNLFTGTRGPGLGAHRSE